MKKINKVSSVLQPYILLEIIFHWCPERVDLMGYLINKFFFYQETVKITYRKIYATSSVHSLNDVHFLPITTENLVDGDDIIGEHAC